MWRYLRWAIMLLIVGILFTGCGMTKIRFNVPPGSPSGFVYFSIDAPISLYIEKISSYGTALHSFHVAHGSPLESSLTQGTRVEITPGVHRYRATYGTYKEVITVTVVENMVTPVRFSYEVLSTDFIPGVQSTTYFNIGYVVNPPIPVQ